MKHLTKWIGKLLFVLMAGALIVYAASRTLDFVNSTLGAEDQIIGYLALFATTGGALAWLSVFLWNSEGIAQKGIALVMIVIDVGGEIALFTVDTLMQSGLNGLTVALVPEEVRLTVLGMSFLIGVNIISTFAYHIMDAENLAAIEEHFADWKIKQAIQKAKTAKAESIADEIAEREAEVYGQAQKAKDRKDHSLPEKTAKEVFGSVKSFFKGNGTSEDLPLAAADTVGLPELRDTGRLTDEEHAKAWANVPKDIEERMAKYGDRSNVDNAVFFHDDGMPRYHPAFGFEGKRWQSTEAGERVMVDDPKVESQGDTK